MKLLWLFFAFVGGGSVLSANIVTNGGFELPVLSPAQYAGYGRGTNFAGWTVVTNDVDLVDASYFAPASGAQSLDLNGGDSGGIFQDLRSTAGVRYRLSFALAGNPSPLGSGPNLKEMEVFWGETSLGIFRHDIAGFNTLDVGWRQFTLVVTGTGMDRLTFRSVTSGTAGPAIDDVSVIPESEITNLVAPLGIRTAVEIAFTTHVGKSYQVQWAAAAATNVWHYLGSAIVGDGKTNFFCEPIEMNSRRLYRVLEVSQ